MIKNTFIKVALSAITASLLLFVTYCGTDSGSDDESVPVSITFSIPSVKMKTGRVLNKPAPSIVKSITISISAAGMTTISDTFNVIAGTTVTRSYSIPPGTERTFTAYAYDGTLASGFLLYQGTSIDDLVAGASTTVLITMAEAAYTGLFVDANRGVDVTGGSPLNPYKTITFALSQAGGSEEIKVAAGTYNTLSGELFPLQLKVGTSLKCVGTGYTTVIDANDPFQTGFLGAAGASIDGCKIINAGPAINDAGTQTTVNKNFMENNCEGVYAQGNSIITNNIITLSQAGDCSGAAINSYLAAGTQTPLIQGNTITGNETGILIENGLPNINNNILSCNNSYDLQSYSPSAIDATNNQWDNLPPSIEFTVCPPGVDICDYGSGAIDTTGYSLAPSPCPTPIS